MRDLSIPLPRLVRFLLVSLLLMLFVPLVMGLLGTPALGAIYKWVDENGKVHYSDKPPPEEGAQEMDIESDPAASTPSLTDAEHRQKQQRLLDAYSKERADKNAERAEADKKERERLVWCARAKDELREFKEASYLYDYDESGEKVIYSKEARESATREYAAEIERNC